MKPCQFRDYKEKKSVESHDHVCIQGTWHLTIQLCFPRSGGNSEIITKRKVWRVMIAYALKGYNIEGVK